MTTETTPVASSEMLIRKPAADVFEAMVNPVITSNFWFTKGSARLEYGINLNLIADHKPQ